MTEPFQNDPYEGDPYQNDPLRGDATQSRAHAVPHPTQHNRKLLIIIGLALLALLTAAAIWQTSGTRGAKRDYASANDRVIAKERDVEEARRTLDQRIAELRVVKAEAEVQAARLGNKVEQQVGGAIDEARVNTTTATASTPGRATDPYTGPAPVYYVRDQQGRFVPVRR